MKRGKPITLQLDGYGLLNHASRVEMVLRVVLFSDAVSQALFIPGLLLYFDRSLHFTKCCDIVMSPRWSAFSSSLHLRALGPKRHSSLSSPRCDWFPVVLYSSGQAWLPWQGDPFASHDHGRLLILFSKGPGVWYSHSACIVTYPSCNKNPKLSRSLHLIAWQC